MLRAISGNFIFITFPKLRHILRSGVQGLTTSSGEVANCNQLNTPRPTLPYGGC